MWITQIARASEQKATGKQSSQRGKAHWLELQERGHWRSRSPPKRPQQLLWHSCYTQEDRLKISSHEAPSRPGQCDKHLTCPLGECRSQSQNATTECTQFNMKKLRMWHRANVPSMLGLQMTLSPLGCSTQQSRILSPTPPGMDTVHCLGAASRSA